MTICFVEIFLSKARDVNTLKGMQHILGQSKNTTLLLCQNEQQIRVCNVLYTRVHWWKTLSHDISIHGKHHLLWYFILNEGTQTLSGWRSTVSNLQD